MILDYQLAGIDSAEPLETKCLNNVPGLIVAGHIERVGSTEIILQRLMVLLAGKCAILSAVAVWWPITSVSATAQGSTFTDFSQRLHATFDIVAMEYQVRLGSSLIFNTKLSLYFIFIPENSPLMHGYRNECQVNQA